MIIACIVFAVVILVTAIVTLTYGLEYDEACPVVAGWIGIFFCAILIAFLIAIFPCHDCGARLCDCECSETVCAECGQTLPEKGKECNRKEPAVESHKCCGACGQEIVVNVEVDCEHTTSVEVETTPETVTPETTKPIAPDCPKCNKAVTSAFCPDCGYDMHATVNCSSCNKEFKADEVPSYCPDCGEKISNS